MTAFVLDASAALSWCFDDEATPAADRLLERLDTETAAVPSLWHLEIANVLVSGERRGRLTQGRSAEFIATLEKLEIAVDETTASRALGRVFELAQAAGLTAYDAAYSNWRSALACRWPAKIANYAMRRSDLG